MTYNAYDFNLNLEKIEIEAEMAVQRESKYWRENDAKLRAVHQKVASYEEFKNIVAASHLKPLNKNENLSQISNKGKNTNWNTFASESINRKLEKDFLKKPNENAKYLEDKNNLFNLSEQKLYERMHQIYHNNELGIFNTELPSELLLRYSRSIINNSSNEKDNDANINWNILEFLGRHSGRLLLTMGFMNDDERSVVRQAIESVHKNLSSQIPSNKDLLKLFSLE